MQQQNRLPDPYQEFDRILAEIIAEERLKNPPPLSNRENPQSRLVRVNSVVLSQPTFMARRESPPSEDTFPILLTGDREIDPALFLKSTSNIAIQWVPK
jgi:hypothetical protein